MRISGIVVLVIMLLGSVVNAKSNAESSEIEMPPFGALKITTSSTTGIAGGTACVDIIADNFEAIISLQFALQFDPTILRPICPPTQLNLFGLMSVNFNCNDADQGFVKMVWLDPNTGLSGGVTEPNGSVLFTLCFDLIGDPGEVSPVFITIDQLDLDLEYAQITDPNMPNDFETFTDAEIMPGQIEIECGTLSLFNRHCDTNPSGTTGSIRFYSCGGSPPYNYNINSGAFTGVINNDREEVIVEDLAAGAYDLTITDSGGAMVNTTVVISNNIPLTVDPVVTPPSCWNRSNGRINISGQISGGQPPYANEWSNFLFNNDELRQLANGTYGLTVTDNTGCKIVENVDVFVDTLRATAQINSITSCPGATDGEIYLAAEGGTPYAGFRYSFIENSPSVDFTDSAVPEGYYFYLVQDGASPACRSELDSIFMPTQANITTEITELDDVSCFGANDGHFLLTLGGGSNFGFRLANEFGDPPPLAISSPNTFESDSLAPGIWYIESNEVLLGCIVFDTIEIFEPEPLSVTKDSINPSCLNGDGVISVTAIGGTITGDYNYNWSDGGSGSMRDDLIGDTYTIVVSDDNMCEDSVIVALAVDGALQLEASVVKEVECAEGNGGIVTVDVTSQGSFAYEWTKNMDFISSDQTPDDLTPGEYIVMVTDTILGCTAFDTITLTNPSDISIMVTYTLPQCPFDNFKNGSIGVTPTGGTPDFTYTWEDGSTGSVRAAISAGVYNVTVSDANGCVLDTLLTLDNPEGIQVDVSSVQGVTCFGTNDGTAIATASGGTVNNGSYNFFWSSAPDDVDFDTDMSMADALGAGIQYVIVADAQCPSDTIFIDVPNIDPIILDTAATIASNPSCFGDIDGFITAQATGGNPNAYSYQWTYDGSISPTLSGIDGGTYFVIITDDNNCSNTDSVTLINPDSLAVEIDAGTTIDLSCFNPGEAQIGVSANGGTPGYLYNWTDGIVDGPIASMLGDGTYFITVTDINGCTDVTSYTLTSPEPVQATIPDPETPECFGGKTCVSVENAMGGLGNNYTFTINRGIRFPIDSCVEVFAGPYKVTVFDSAGCSVDYDINIAQPEELNVSLGDDFEISLGEASPPINADITAIFNIDSILWSPIDSLECMTSDCQVISVKPTQTTTYIVQIVDENGCVDRDEIEVRVNKKRNVFIPNIFSPNADSFNDFFQLFTGVGVTSVEYLRIFDRWGNQVFTRENYLPSNTGDDGWNGKYKGDQVLPGVYPYIARVRFIDGEFVIFKGGVTLVR